jgi:hypothetical protein
MPWKRAKALPPPDNTLFEACFRIQREACEAAGRHIPLVVENVCGAQKWVGKAEYHYGSYFLWGDVPALMPMTGSYKSTGMNWSDQSKRGQDFTRIAGQQAIKNTGHLNKRDGHGHTRHLTNPAEHIKQCGDWFSDASPGSLRSKSVRSLARKAASALIAKIPFELARWIARCLKPRS